MLFVFCLGQYKEENQELLWERKKWKGLFTAAAADQHGSIRKDQGEYCWVGSWGRKNLSVTALRMLWMQSTERAGRRRKKGNTVKWSEMGGFLHCVHFFNAFNKIVILRKDLCLHNLQLQAVSKSKHRVMPSLPRNCGRGRCQEHFLLRTGINLLSQKKLPSLGKSVWLADKVRAPESVQSPYSSEGKNTSQERNNGLQAPLHHRSQYLFQHTRDKL